MGFDERELARFLRLWEKIGAFCNGKYVFYILKRAYEEGHRKYHTTKHIRHCLEEFRAVWRVLKDPSTVEMAIWFHDAFFVPGAPDNEERSAKLAQEMLRAGGASDEVGARVAQLIMATKHDGRISPHDHDAVMLADIDLSSLGAHPKLFDESARLIRSEMRASKEECFRRQALFLREIYARKNIYAPISFTKNANGRRGETSNAL